MYLRISLIGMLLHFGMLTTYTIAGDAAEKEKVENEKNPGTWTYLAWLPGSRLTGIEFEQEQDQKMQVDLKTVTKDNMKWMMIAWHNFHEDLKRLPRNIYSKEGKPLLSWRVAILPYIEQDQLYKQFKLDEPWDSEHNRKLISKMPETYAVGEHNQKQNTTPFRAFVGIGTGMEFNKDLRFTDYQDGTSNTLGFVEAAESVIWTKPYDLEYQPQKPLPHFGKNFDNVFLAANMDGSIRVIPHSTPEATLRALITRNGSEKIDLSKLGFEPDNNNRQPVEDPSQAQCTMRREVAQPSARVEPLVNRLLLPANKLRIHRAASPLEELKSARLMILEGTIEELLVHPQLELTLDDISEVALSTDPQKQLDLAITLNKAGASKLAQLSLVHQGKQLAIVVNGKLLAACKLQAPINDGCVLLSGLSKTQADELLQLLNRK
jgi:hypothetical protein